MSAPMAPSIASDKHVFLIGRPPIGELLGFIRTMSVDGQGADLAQLTNDWRAANDHVQELELSEAGAADDPPILPLPAAITGLAESVLADPAFQMAYRFVPTRIAMVELDRLVVFQKFINLAFVEQLKVRLGPTPTSEAVLRFALLDPQPPQFTVMQNSQNTYTFMSESTDFRFLEAQLVLPAQIPSFKSSGRPETILALSVGYGSNFLNVLSVENRLVLCNGSHRAFALRDAGITHVPAIVQCITRRDELELVASGDFAGNPDRYLKTARPAMLRDYFDSRLRKIVPVSRKRRTVRLQFAFEQTDTPAQ